MWKALMKARLIFPTPDESLAPGEVNWEGCEYSKCGRTDKGVSAFGQVIGLKVRSNRPLMEEQSYSESTQAATKRPVENGSISGDQEPAKSMLESDPYALQDSLGSTGTLEKQGKRFDPINDEIPYPQVLNRLLPPDIRVLAWCPSPPEDFSARFSCKERRYKYFFTQPAFSPTIGSGNDVRKVNGDKTRSRREGWLDIQAMREAAAFFVGLHDFRNFCKVDASKQIENFERRIFRATIDELDPHVSPMGYLNGPKGTEYGGENTTHDDSTGASAPKIYAFTLHGSAFLWHQVRHMVAILFLIGQGLESPSLVKELLEVKKNPGRPQYEMADDAPLVLWDCIFPREGGENREDALDWVHIGDSAGSEGGISQANNAKDGKHGFGGVIDEMWKVWRRRKIDEVLAGTLLDVIASQGQSPQGTSTQQFHKTNYRGSQKVFAGGDSARLMGKYVPILKKPRMENVEVINSRYATRKASKDGDVGTPP